MDRAGGGVGRPGGGLGEQRSDAVALPVLHGLLPAEEVARLDRGRRDELQGLLRRLADGDRAAMSPAYQLLWPLLRSFCARALGPFGLADADDAAQAALLKIIDRDLFAAAEEVLGSLSAGDRETLLCLLRSDRPGGATFRKRLQRALSRFRLAWRARHGLE